MERKASRDQRPARIDALRCQPDLQQQLAVDNLTNADEWEMLYRFMYDNLHEFGFNEVQQDEAILRIAQAYNSHIIVGDPEINFAALMVQLFRITKE